jgi:protein gp37
MTLGVLDFNVCFRVHKASPSTVIRDTPNLDWLMLTKRASRIERYLPKDWGNGYANVWLGVTAENRQNGYPRVGILRTIPAVIRFLSIEPLLEDVSDINLTGIHWIIVGGESGSRARPFDIEWARNLKTVARRYKSKFFMKQLGQHPVDGGVLVQLTHKQADGKRDLHGKALANLPTDLQVQEVPIVKRLPIYQEALNKHPHQVGRN